MLVRLATTQRLQQIWHDGQLMLVKDDPLPEGLDPLGWHLMVGVDGLAPGLVKTRWLVMQDEVADPVEAFLTVSDKALNDLPQVEHVFLRDDYKRWLHQEGIESECASCQSVVPILQAMIDELSREVRTLARIIANGARQPS